MNKGMKYERFKNEWKKLYDSGMSFRQIAIKYNIDAKTVNRTIGDVVEKRSKSPFDKFEDIWYKLHVNEGYSKTEIAKKYNVSIGVVTRVLKKSGIESNKIESKRKYLHLLPEFIRLYQEGLSLGEISKKTGVNKQTILNYLREADVQVRDLSESIRTYNINETYFDVIDTSKKAYQLGVLFGTATCLEQHNGYVVQMTLGERKIQAIQDLLDTLTNEDKYGLYIGSDLTIRIRLNSRHLYNVLKGYGLKMRRDTVYPNIKKELNPYFVSGYLKVKGSFVNNSYQIYGSGNLLKTIKRVLLGFLEEEQMKVLLSSTNESKIVIETVTAYEEVLNFIYQKEKDINHLKGSKIN